MGKKNQTAADELPETPNQESTETVTTSGVRIRPDLTKMVKSSKGTMRKADFVAEALDGLSVEEGLQVASLCGFSDKVAKNKHLNPGQQRMCIGGSLRALAKKEGGEEKITEAVEAVKAARPAPAPAPAVQSEAEAA